MKNRASLFAALLLLAGAVSTNGQAATAEDRVADLERRLDENARLIEQLNARVHDLEARLPATAAAAPAVVPSPAPVNGSGDTAERLAAVEHEVSEIAAASATVHSESALAVHGFADVGAGTRSPINPDHKGFTVGSLDFYLSPGIGERVRTLFELNFEVEESGEVATDLERAQIGYQLGDTATVWLGRFHTPYGFYNNAFHHGQQISMAVRRPRFLAFEDQGGVLPAHTVGLWMTGSRRMGDGRWSYDAFVGNAQRIVDGTLDMQQAGITDGEMLLGGNFGYSPGGALEGLKVGASFFTANVLADTPVPSKTRVRNYGLYAVYDTDNWENLVEWYRFDDADQSGGTGSHRSNAGFLQVAYRVGRVAPYARYERSSLDQTDSYFSAQASGGSYYRTAAGIRFDLDLSAAIKLEFGRTTETDRAEDEFSDAMLQYAIRF